MALLELIKLLKFHFEVVFLDFDRSQSFKLHELQSIDMSIKTWRIITIAFLVAPRVIRTTQRLQHISCNNPYRYFEIFVCCDHFICFCGWFVVFVIYGDGCLGSRGELLWKLRKLIWLTLVNICRI